MGQGIQESYLWNDPFWPTVRKVEVIQANVSLFPLLEIVQRNRKQNKDCQIIAQGNDYYDFAMIEERVERLINRQELNREKLLNKRADMKCS